MIPPIGSVCCLARGASWIMINCTDAEGNREVMYFPEFMTVLGQEPQRLSRGCVVVMFPDGNIWRISRFFFDDGIMDVI
jgi:hypothetical protein